MNTNNDFLEWQLKIKKAISDIDRNQAEISKALNDSLLALASTKLTDKKVKWYEVSLIFIVFGLGVALAKVFL